MSRKSYIVQIWFLDEDLYKSAQYQTNKSLVKSITGCMQALLAARFYFIGIHTKKMYNQYFDNVHKDETLAHYFPLWPLKQKPCFMQYSSRESKWTRKCKEHYDYVMKYFGILLDEYLYRFNKEHGLYKLAEWLNVDAPTLPIKYANISKIVLPWKQIDVKWRRADILDSYRLKFINSLNCNPTDAFMKTKRDIPDFVIKYFKLDLDCV